MSPRTPPTRSPSRSVSPPQSKKSSRHHRKSSRDRRDSRSRSRSPLRSDSGTPPHSAHGRRGSGRSSDYHGSSSRSGHRKSRTDSYSSGSHYDRASKISSRHYETVKRYEDGREKAEPCPCLGIFGMNHSTTEKDLFRIFKEFGFIKSVRIVNDRGSGRSRGFGFIYFSETHEAEKAKAEMEDAKIDGFKVRIDYSVTNHNPEKFTSSSSRSRRTPSPPRH